MSKFNVERKVWEATKVPYPYATDTFVGEEILKALKETPDRICQVSVQDNHELTCHELRMKSVCVAQNLMKLGIQPSEVVGIVCRQSHLVTMAFFGCIFIGAPANPLDISFNKKEIMHFFGQTKPKLIICDSDQVVKVREALEELDIDAKVYTIPYGDQEGNFNLLLATTGKEDEFVAPKFDQPADEKILAVLCSSGTTGLPKGVMMSHASFLSMISPIVSSLPKGELRVYCSSPFYWSFGVMTCLLSMFLRHSLRIFSGENFSVDHFSEIVTNYKPTFVITSPMNLSLLLLSDFATTVDHDCLKSIGVVGAVVSETTREKFSKLFPDKDLMIFYGLNEAGYGSTYPGEYKVNGTVGSFIYFNFIVKIIDENGQNLGVGESGEICIKTHAKFLGYYNKPEATKNAVDSEGFVKSGDVGYFDESGKLFVIDRKKEIVKCRSYPTNLSEIESLIETIEGVELVCVVGIPDPVYDTLPAAVVVKRSGFDDLTEKFIADFVAEQLPLYKHLTGGVYFVDKMPMTPSGKIQKNIVSETVMSKFATGKKLE